MINALPPEIEDLLTAEVFEFAGAARSHFGTDDLVVILDMTGATSELDAQPRMAMMICKMARCATNSASRHRRWAG